MGLVYWCTNFNNLLYTKYPRSSNTTMVYLIITMSDTLSAADITILGIPDVPKSKPSPYPLVINQEPHSWYSVYLLCNTWWINLITGIIGALSSCSPVTKLGYLSQLSHKEGWVLEGNPHSRKYTHAWLYPRDRYPQKYIAISNTVNTSDSCIWKHRWIVCKSGNWTCARKVTIVDRGRGEHSEYILKSLDSIRPA